MNILILNGAPAGDNSITLQTMLYIQKFFPEHHYEQLNVGQRIKAIERDFSGAQATNCSPILAQPTMSELPML